MRKTYGDWVNNVWRSELKAYDRLEEQGRTWLENEEVDMAELEIDIKDIHDRKKWRRNIMNDKVQYYRQTDYKPMII